MRTIPDRINLRAYCLGKAIEVYNMNVDQSIIAIAQSFEEYILGDIDLPDHAHYPDTFLTINNNNCPCDIIDDDDEGEEWKHN